VVPILQSEKKAHCSEVQNADQRLQDLLISSLHHCAVLSLWVFLSLTQECKENHCKFIAAAKLIETICFANFAIFHVYFMQIYV